MQIDLKATEALTAAERAELDRLTRAVYPPEEAVHEAEPVVWAPPAWHILVRDDASRLVAHVGLLTRAVLYDGESVRIGGIGGVKTHPEARGQGYASAAMARADTFFVEEAAVPFALLGCPTERISFYAGLGWERFHGVLMVEQSGSTAPFTRNTAMVRAMLHAAPTDGILDLQGPPW